MSGFTKLFGSILDSSVWQESKETRLVWITMLAMSDKNGVIESSVPGLADRAKVTLAECEAAINTFLAPDKWSRSREFEGRRIECIDGGWRLLNHAKYRAKLSAEERRAYKAAKQAEYRKKANCDKPASAAYKSKEAAAVKRFEDGDLNALD